MVIESGELSPNAARLTACRAGDIVVVGEKGGFKFLYTDDPDIQSGRKFLAEGLQIAAGVPLQCDEPADFRSFRIGLFGLDKFHNVDRTVQFLEEALRRIR